ncbi:MBOAT family O-acyltransferase (plasmid) [Tistrella mobilis]|uniref:Membrane bound O-acyl transferase MBOAT family protein n=1 Tax=Tistrella mobilis TaxID=171437 RepID=A0A162K292_9PROT|nr:MBOAT family O-acyltransferase [Tistrella mobilis]KYO50334.1 hypothetical protein AUP44_01450 [Tistrella mobilis]
MIFLEPSFLALAVAFIAVTAWPMPEAWFRLVLGGFSLAFLALCLGPAQIALLGGFVATGFAATYLARRHGWRAAGPGLVVILAEFALVKTAGLLPLPVDLAGAAGVLGLAYVLARMVHLLVDTASDPGGTPPVTAGRYLLFTLNFLTFLSGPLQRWPDHLAAMADRQPAGEAARLAALGRILLGYVKILFALPLCDALHDWLVLQATAPVIAGIDLGALAARLLGPEGPGVVAVSFHIMAATIFPIRLYLNFSAYMDVVIGIGRLAGLRVPENFDHPFRADCLLDFWTRWHITMSRWYQDYVFTPLVTALHRRWPSPRAMELQAMAGTFVTFLVVGLWHDVSLRFLAIGLLIGLGMIWNRGWRWGLRAAIGTGGWRRLKARGWYRAVSAVSAYLFLSGFVAAFTWLYGGAPMPDIAPGPLAVLALLPAALWVLAGGLVWRAGSAWMDGRFVPRRVSPRACFGFAVAICALAMVAALKSEPIPEFIYAGF